MLASIARRSARCGLKHANNFYKNPLVCDNAYAKLHENICSDYTSKFYINSARAHFASSSTSQASSLSSKIVHWYLNSLQKRPLITKSITTCGIFGGADLTAQFISFASQDNAERKSLLEKIDWYRTLRMSSVGLILSGPTLHLWFGLMAKVFPGTDIKNSLKKMFLGQTVYGPIFNTIFFSLNGAALGESRSEILARLKRDLLPTFRNGLFYWPPCDLITYRYVPLHLQGSQRFGTKSMKSSTPHQFAFAQQSRSVSHFARYDLGSSHPHPPPSPSPSPLLSPLHPFHLQQTRSYIQLRTELEVADNSGAKRVQCIKVLKGAKPNAASLGDVIIASVKDAQPRGKVKKGEVVTCVVVRAGMLSRRSDGSQIKFDHNAVVIINKAHEPLGTRVFGPVPHELRERNMVKILALAQHVT